METIPDNVASLTDTNNENDISNPANHEDSSNIDNVNNIDVANNLERGNFQYVVVDQSDEYISEDEEIIESDNDTVPITVSGDDLSPGSINRVILGNMAENSSSSDIFEMNFNSDNSSDVISNIDTQNNSESLLDITHVKKSADKKVRDEEELNEGPPEKKEKREIEKKDLDSDDDDGQTCSICLECWSNFGEHRLCSLKCGHLFGHSCIVRWLSQKLVAQRTCPTCKSLAKVKDVRFIYAKKVKMTDNYELFTAQSELSKAFLENNKLKLDLYKVSLHRDNLRQNNIQLESELKKYKLAGYAKPSSNATDRVNQISLSMEMSMEITSDDSCRVFTYSSIKDDLIITQKISNNMFPGYGIRNVNCGLGRLGKVTLIHPKMIRDLAFSERNKLLLTASFDKTAKLYCDTSGSITTSFNCDSQLWSCCWDLERPDRLYLGGVGRILQYDIRQPRSCVSTIESDHFTPIIMVSYLQNGLLSCHLNSVKAHRKLNSVAFESQNVPLEGGLLSARAINSKVLISLRPTSSFTRSRNVLCDIDLMHEFHYSEKTTFYSGPVRKLLSRSCLMDISNNDILAVADNESEQCVQIWNTSDGSVVQNIPTSIPVIDTWALKRGGDSFLATLTQRSCKLYKAVLKT